MLSKCPVVTLKQKYDHVNKHSPALIMCDGVCGIQFLAFDLCEKHFSNIIGLNVSIDFLV